MIKKTLFTFLKLSLIILVIFGMFGSVIGAEYFDKYGNKINGEMFAGVITKSGDAKAFVRTYDQYDKVWTIYELDLQGKGTVEIVKNKDSNKGLNFLKEISDSNPTATIEYRDSSTAQYRELSSTELKDLTKNYNAQIVKTSAIETQKKLTQEDLDKLASIGIKAGSLGTDVNFNSIEGYNVNGNKCQVTTSKDITCFKMTDDGQYIVNFVIDLSIPNLIQLEKTLPPFISYSSSSQISTEKEKTQFPISYDEKTKKFYTQSNTNNKIETPLLEIIKQNPNYIYNLDQKAKTELDKILNIYDEKSLYQLKSSDFTLYQALSTYTDNSNIKTKFENIENFQTGKITDATEAKRLLDAGIPLTTSAYNILANEYKTISSQIIELETKIAGSTLSQTEKDTAKKELDNLKKNNVALIEISKRGLNDMDFISSCLKETSCTLDSLANSFETKPADWKGLWLNGVSKQMQLEQAIMKSYENYKTKLNNELSICTKNSGKTQTQCMDEYSTNLETETEKLIASLAISGFTDESFKDKLRQNIKKDKLVQTNIGYDILTVILSPDQNAMSAAKFFGAEADYSNVPKFLSESIPSQICLAKIDGYLDKTKESSINGQGGLTSYGCSQEYTQVYDEETKKYKKMPQTQCLEVLADLRAQRTQVTPDMKTAISYSYYIKAPPNTELKYIVAISYVEGNTIKKQTIVPLTKTSGIKNGFDSVELFLNATGDEINENSFTINLLAIYENNNVYQKLSYSIPPITTGNSYSAPIPAQVSNSNTGSRASQSQASAELSTEDMLAMI